MKITDDILNFVYDKTNGYCNICDKKLSFHNHGKMNRKGAWEIDHSKPKSKGGTDHLNNLYAACIDCNRGKSNFSTKTSRKWFN